MDAAQLKSTEILINQPGERPVPAGDRHPLHAGLLKPGTGHLAGGKPGYIEIRSAVEKGRPFMMGCIQLRSGEIAGFKDRGPGHPFLQHSLAKIAANKPTPFPLRLLKHPILPIFINKLFLLPHKERSPFHIRKIGGLSPPVPLRHSETKSPPKTRLLGAGLLCFSLCRQGHPTVDPQ